MILLALLLVLFAAAVVLAAAETSLIRVRRSAVEVEAARGGRRARRLLRLLADLPLVLNTVLLTVLLAQIGAATVTGVVAADVFGNLGATLASIALTIVLFVYAESIPKTFAVRHPLGVAMALATPIALLSAALRPVVRILVAFADLQAPGEGIAGPQGVSEEELRRLAAEAERAGEIEASDLDLVERAFRFGDATIERVLVPRTDIVAVPVDALTADALDIAVAGGYRRLPVFNGDLDDITGVVLLRDLARAVADGTSAKVGQLARPVLFVPESGRILDLLRRMQDAGTHFAVVVDEYGGTAGIATIEDLAEELIGEVADEGERRPTSVQRVAEGRWRVDASAAIDEVALSLGATLPAGDWTTAGGLVIGLLGHIPQPGDSVAAAGFLWTVVSATRRRVRIIDVQRAPPDVAGGEADELG